MAKFLLALLSVTSLLYQDVSAQSIAPAIVGNEINFSCVNKTAFQMYVESEGKIVTTPAVACGPGQVCDAGADLPCVASPRSAVQSFQCAAHGKFSDPDPCVSAFYLCIDTVYNGFQKIDLTCGPGFGYSEPYRRCVPLPVECSIVGSAGIATVPQMAAPNAPAPAAEAFTCPSSGRYPVEGVCNQYHVCYRFLWSFRHFVATCKRNLEYNSIKRKCVPSWYSDCGMDKYQMPWRRVYYGKAIVNSSEEDDFPDEDKLKKAIKKMEKELKH